MAPRITVIGHITRDLIEHPGQPIIERPGGTVYYTAIALAALGSEVRVLTKLNPKHKHLLREFTPLGIEVIARKSAHTTTFENRYHDPQQKKRSQKRLAEASPFDASDLEALRNANPSWRDDWLHLGPLSRTEWPASLSTTLQAPKISIDLQGAVRTVHEQEVKPSPPEKADLDLSPYHTIKADRQEAQLFFGAPTSTGNQILTGTDSELAHAFLRAGTQECLLTFAHEGALVANPTGVHRVYAFAPKKVVDATGCGDTFMAAYIHARLTGSPLSDAGQFAAWAAARKITQIGPLVPIAGKSSTVSTDQNSPS